MLEHGGLNREYDGKKADVWSCGVVLYVMLCAKYPFDHECDEHLGEGQRRQIVYQRVRSASFKVPSRVSISEGCLDLLQQLLSPDPTSRPSTGDIMRHQWFAHGLNKAAFEFNQRPDLVPPPNAQSESSILAILNKAQKNMPTLMYKPLRLKTAMVQR